MRTLGFTFALAAFGLSFTALPATAASTVQRVDGDTLLVIDYQGKPPFKRRIVSISDSPVEFARFEELAGGNSAAAITGNRRSGPPGKSMRGPRASASGETAEFARFEEGSDADPSARHWRGPPGKGNPRLGE